MFALAVPGITEPDGWGRCTSKGVIVPHVIPQSSGDCPAFRQNRHGSVVRVQALCRQHMRPDQRSQGSQRRGAGSHPVGQR